MNTQEITQRFKDMNNEELVKVATQLTLNKLDEYMLEEIETPNEFNPDSLIINPYDDLIYDTDNMDLKNELKNITTKKFYKSLTISIKTKGKTPKKRLHSTKYTIYSSGEEIELHPFYEGTSIGMQLADSKLWLPVKHKKQVILFLINHIPTVPIEGDAWEMWYGIYNGTKLDMGIYKGKDKDKQGRCYIKIYNEEKFKPSYYKKLQEFNFEKRQLYVSPEIPNGIYDNQEPTFTKEFELEDIAGFLHSLKHRVLSGEEQELLNTIHSEVSILTNK